MAPRIWTMRYDLYHAPGFVIQETLLFKIFSLPDYYDCDLLESVVWQERLYVQTNEMKKDANHE